ncbi:unnamed protein product, partial [Prorocentrum cordatum]
DAQTGDVTYRRLTKFDKDYQYHGKSISTTFKTDPKGMDDVKKERKALPQESSYSSYSDSSDESEGHGDKPGPAYPARSSLASGSNPDADLLGQLVNTKTLLKGLRVEANPWLAPFKASIADNLSVLEACEETITAKIQGRSIENAMEKKGITASLE